MNAESKRWKQIMAWKELDDTKVVGGIELVTSPQGD